MPRCFLAKKSAEAAISVPLPISVGVIKTEEDDEWAESESSSKDTNATATLRHNEDDPVDLAHNRSTIGSISAAEAVRSIQEPLRLSMPPTKSSSQQQQQRVVFPNQPLPLLKLPTEPVSPRRPTSSSSPPSSTSSSSSSSSPPSALKPTGEQHKVNASEPGILVKQEVLEEAEDDNDVEENESSPQTTQPEEEIARPRTNNRRRKRTKTSGKQSVSVTCRHSLCSCLLASLDAQGT